MNSAAETHHPPCAADTPRMTRFIQISRVGGTVLTRVRDGNKQWDRSYSSLMEACREAAAIGLILPRQAREAEISGLGLKLPCSFIDHPAMMEGGFQRVRLASGCQGGRSLPEEK